MVLISSMQNFILTVHHAGAAAERLVSHRLPICLTKVEWLHLSEYLLLPLLLVDDVVLKRLCGVWLNHSFIEVLPFGFLIHKFGDFFFDFNQFTVFTRQS